MFQYNMQYVEVAFVSGNFIEKLELMGLIRLVSLLTKLKSRKHIKGLRWSLQLMVYSFSKNIFCQLGSCFSQRVWFSVYTGYSGVFRHERTPWYLRPQRKNTLKKTKKVPEQNQGKKTILYRKINEKINTYQYQF